MEKTTPIVDSKLRHIVKVTQCIYDVSGITINGRRIKSLIFSTDVAIISNCNADAVIAVYPFTRCTVSRIFLWRIFTDVLPCMDDGNFICSYQFDCLFYFQLKCGSYTLCRDGCSGSDWLFIM